MNNYTHDQSIINTYKTIKWPIDPANKYTRKSTNKNQWVNVLLASESKASFLRPPN